ncbi:formate/nitrite transporter family protein [Lysobacter sp. H23M47]|uniref:formate/nitrite transporter family protein n=1 Tax=Lysobacter sp. H23M47 TaxID=2781024 RepID=UPI001880D3DF|nr:formate/nitrite transporter family protein [Lysobacter sp. H23M47]QOW24288.1 formate/nitrite transporter family protein [Lysobacter sp. H23M47]
MPDENDKDARKRADEQAEARDEAEVEETLKEESDSGFSLSDEERRDVEERSAPRAALLHEIIRRAGQEELKRNIATLAWSAFAAGLTMGFSFLARGVLHRHMEGLPGAFLVDSMGYTFGFLAVIVARQQLFTENVLTAVLPLMTKPSAHNFGRLLRLWSVVLAGNLVGATVFAFGLLHMDQFDAAGQAAFVAVGRELMDNSALEMFTKGILAGWIIAMMVWMMAATERSRVAIILICTYVIAIGGFTHIVVGSAEAMYMVFAGESSFADAALRFALPTLAGNVVGGSLIFALLSHAQVRSGGE